MAAKIFEVGDVLPATTQLRISWNEDFSLSSNVYVKIHTPFFSYPSFTPLVYCEIEYLHYDVIMCYISFYNDYASGTISVYEPDGYISPYTNPSGGHNYCDIDISTLSEADRTVSSITGGTEGSQTIFYWEDVASTPSGYTISFNSNGGTTISDIEEATELPTPLPTPTKSGYTFVNWYYDSAFTQKATAGDTLESNVTLYAKWHNLGSLFTEIADAIRSKDGTSENIRDVDFGERVKQIQGAKEEETKTVTPNFASGNAVVTPTSGKVLSQVTINKDTNLIADNIKKDVVIYGITGTLESGIDVSDANAVVGEVLAGKTFYAVDDTKKTGTMPNRGTVSTDITTKAQEVTIQQGYHSGSGKVKISATEQAKIIASNIKSGVTILGQEGAVTPAKEEQTKTVSPTTSSQDVLPDSGKVLSKVTVNAIPTETKSQQPSLGSGNQTINATSGKFMTSFTITKDTINHIASNIRSGITLYGVTGNLQPAKEEETKTVTPNFASGNVVVTPTTNKVLTQVTINKDTNLIADNIKKDVTVHGITGTLESGGGGYVVVLYSTSIINLSSIIGTLQYSLDDGSTWIDITKTHDHKYGYIQDIIPNVTTIKFRASCTGGGLDYISVLELPQYIQVLKASGGYGTVTSNNITLTDNQIYNIVLYRD